MKSVATSDAISAEALHDDNMETVATAVPVGDTLALPAKKRRLCNEDAIMQTPVAVTDIVIYKPRHRHTAEECEQLEHEFAERQIETQLLLKSEYCKKLCEIETRLLRNSDLEEAHRVIILDRYKDEFDTDLESKIDSFPNEREAYRNWLEGWNDHLLYHHKRGWITVRALP